MNRYHEICKDFGINLIEVQPGDENCIANGEESYIESSSIAGNDEIYLGMYQNERLRLISLFHEIGHTLVSREYIEKVKYNTLYIERKAWIEGMKVLKKYYPKFKIGSEEVEYIDECLSTYNHYSFPTSVFNVVKYIVKKTGPINKIKLQKLAYYCKVWSLIWDGKTLFKENAEAWIFGPAIKELHEAFNHDKLYVDSFVNVDNENVLTKYDKRIIDEVLGGYSRRTTQWLMELSISETPWIEARKGLDQNERGTNIISEKLIYDFYKQEQ